MRRRIGVGSVGQKTLEQGDIFFFYHPKHGLDAVEGPEDVASFHIILHPFDGNKCRYAAVSLKGLLESGGEGGWWARMEMVDVHPAAIQRKLRNSHPLPMARPCGEGVYAILRHGRHTHMAYALELPEKPAEVQHALGIFRRENPYIAILNPLQEAREEAALSPQVSLPEYPPHLLRKFGDRRFHPADPPELLDYPGAEFLVARRPVAAAEDLGLGLHPETETVETSEVFRVLSLRADEAPLEPLLQGHWA
jgi:hypothetical protein